MESTGDRHHAKNLNESVRNHAQLPKCVRLDVMFAHTFAQWYRRNPSTGASKELQGS